MAGAPGGPRGPGGDALTSPPAPPGALPLRRPHVVAGALLLGLLVSGQALAHLDAQSPYLYMTTPPFPVGAGTGAEGYVFWLEGHPTYAESWQPARQAALFAGASDDLTTGDTDARAGYAYLWALLALPLGYYWGAVLLNLVSWYLAALATWYLALGLLGRHLPAYGAALLVALGQGFVAMVGTPMSYVAGYAWSPVLLALAHRWNLIPDATYDRPSPGRRHWALWGWLAGVAGLFYFTNLVTLGALLLLGLPTARLRHLLLAAALTLAVPASWELAGRSLVGLQFQSTTAADLSSNVHGLLQTALARPLLLPSEAGGGSARALAGGFSSPTLPLAALGIVLATPRRRRWYLAVALCGLAPAMILHHLPVTQRYGYLAFPAIYIAAAEGAWRLAVRLGAPAAGRGATPAEALSSPSHPSQRRWAVALLGLVALAQLVQANADLWGIHRFALAFGAP